MKLTSPWRLDPQDNYATEPFLARLQADAGALWVAWVERDKTSGRQNPVAGRLGDLPSDFSRSPDTRKAITETLDGVRCGSPGQTSWPSLVEGGDQVRLVWAASDDRHSGSLVWSELSVGGCSLSKPEVLIQADRIARPVSGWTPQAWWVAYECRRDGQHSIELLEKRHNGQTTIHTLASDTTDLRLRPSLAINPDDGRALVVWEAHQTGAIIIEGALMAPSGGLQKLGALASGQCFNQGPSVAWAPDGAAWMAWASDRPPNGQPALVRWTRLRRLSWQGDRLQLHDPAQPPPEQNFDVDGEDQSLEFPAVVCGGDGRVWVMARASHNVRLQCFGQDGWGELSQTEPVLWGCRGTRMNLLDMQSDRLALCYHGRRGIQVQLLEGQPGGGVQVDALKAVSVTAPVAPLSAAKTRERPLWQDHGAYWGDIHFHSAHSDGVGTVEEAYLRCRDRYHHDFACLTEHDAFIGRRVTDTVWQMMVSTAEAFNRPQDGFATLIGIEYTGPRYPGPGHKCVYFDNPDVPVVCRWDGLEAPEDLLAAVESHGGIAIPHHVGWLGGDPENHRRQVQPCWEVCSCHGQYEAPMDDIAPAPFAHRLGLEHHQDALRGHFIRRQLESGQRFGFVGGSDGHGLRWHHGVSRKEDSHTTGLTGVWLPDGLGRAAIMAAIRAGRTWGTSGAMMSLGVQANGVWQGGTLPAPPAQGVALEWSAQTSAPWREVIAFAQGPQGQTTVVGRWTHDGDGLRAAQSVHISADKLRQEAGFLYVRAVQDDGECAWASPIFWG